MVAGEPIKQARAVGIAAYWRGGCVGQKLCGCGVVFCLAQRLRKRLGYCGSLRLPLRLQHVPGMHPIQRGAVGDLVQPPQRGRHHQRQQQPDQRSLGAQLEQTTSQAALHHANGHASARTGTGMGCARRGAAFSGCG